MVTDVEHLGSFEKPQKLDRSVVSTFSLFIGVA